MILYVNKNREVICCEDFDEQVEKDAIITAPINVKNPSMVIHSLIELSLVNAHGRVFDKLKDEFIKPEICANFCVIAEITILPHNIDSEYCVQKGVKYGYGQSLFDALVDLYINIKGLNK